MTVKERIIKVLIEMEEDYYGDTVSSTLADDDDILTLLFGLAFDIIDLIDTIEIEFDIIVYDGDFREKTTLTLAQLTKYVEEKLKG